MSGLTGKTMVITGGASGLGREIALQAAALGARVVLMDVRQDRLDETAATVRGAGGECRTVRADVRSEQEVIAAVETATQAWGSLDTVVNSAGVIWRGPLVETSMADYDLMHEVNVRGVYLVCREAARVMLKQGSGHIINIASIAGKRGIPNESGYSSGKWAIVGLGETLALELGPAGIRVTTICPGGMDTTFWDTDPRDRASFTNMLDAAHVAQAVVQIAALPEGVVVKEALVYRPGS